jgi:hypothetical protein
MKFFADEIRKAIKKMNEVDLSPRMIVIPEKLAFDIAYRLTDVESEIKQAEKETAKEILKMFYDRNYITEQDLKNAIAERFGLEGETWR